MLPKLAPSGLPHLCLPGLPEPCTGIGFMLFSLDWNARRRIWEYFVAGKCVPGAYDFYEGSSNWAALPPSPQRRALVYDPRFFTANQVAAKIAHMGGCVDTCVTWQRPGAYRYTEEVRYQLTQNMGRTFQMPGFGGVREIWVDPQSYGSPGQWVPFAGGYAIGEQKFGPCTVAEARIHIVWLPQDSTCPRELTAEEGWWPNRCCNYEEELLKWNYMCEGWWAGPLEPWLWIAPNCPAPPEGACSPVPLSLCPVAQGINEAMHYSEPWRARAWWLGQMFRCVLVLDRLYDAQTIRQLGLEGHKPGVDFRTYLYVEKPALYAKWLYVDVPTKQWKWLEETDDPPAAGGIWDSDILILPEFKIWREWGGYSNDPDCLHYRVPQSGREEIDNPLDHVVCAWGH